MADKKNAGLAPERDKTPEEGSFFMENLRIGASGTDVERLQEMLQNLGYRIPVTNGYFDIATRNAVLAFQNDRGLPVDGVAGEKTWTALMRETASTPGSEAVPAPHSPRREEPARWTEPARAEAGGDHVTPNPAARTEAQSTAVSRPEIQMGNRNRYVTDLQRQLKDLGFYNGNITGYYGALTRSAVIRFQRDKGLEPTGVTDAVTWDAIMQKSAAPGLPVSAPVEAAPADAEVWTPDTLWTPDMDAPAAPFATVPEDAGAATDRAAFTGIAAESALPVWAETQAPWADIQAESAELPGVENEMTRPVTPGMPPNAEFPMLREGATGATVRFLQDQLTALGYYPLNEPPRFGSETTMAVKNFQIDNGLPPDGVVDANTWGALMAVQAE